MPSAKKCSKCGVTFECCAETRGCWCEAYTLSTDILKELKEHFDNCLCPKCLAEYAEKEKQAG